MFTKKEDTIFNLNNILLSAFNDDANYKATLIAENDSLLDDVEDTLKIDYKRIKSGKLIEIESDEFPTYSRALEFYAKGEYEQCLWDCSRVIKQDPSQESTCTKALILALLEIKDTQHIIKKYIPIVKKNLEKDEDMLDILANIYFSSEEYKKALPIFEKLVKKYPNDRVGFSYHYKLSYIYERVYQDKYLDKQIELAEKAYSINNDVAILAFLGKLYHRKGDLAKSDLIYKKMMENNPSPYMVLGYSHYLMNTRRITQGYDVYRTRFKVTSVAYPRILTNETRWDGKADISNADVIAHYEQGFGDSVMFSRYIKDLSKLAKSVTFVVQKNLVPLFKSSGYESFCKLLSHEADVNPNYSTGNQMGSVMFNSGNGMSRIPHDYHIPLADLPYLLKESPEKMEHAGGYLKADPKKVEAYRKKYIKPSNKIKIGFAYHGTKASIQTFRDVPAKEFLPLFKMKNLEFYSFQADENSKELLKLDKSLKIHNLATTFKTFEETACAMNCMDLIISTDNVIMNLAGALGIKAYGLFNIYPEARWYDTTGENLGWYKSVRPFKVKTFNAWKDLMQDVIDAIKQDFNL